MPRKNYYAILGVAPQESAGGIRAAFRTLAKRYHPDHAGPGGTRAFLLIQEAYAVLADSRSREDYDATLRRDRTTEPPAQALKQNRSGARHPPRAWPAPEPLIPPSRHSAYEERLVPERRLSLRDFSLWPSPAAVFERLARNYTGVGVPKSERAIELGVEVLLERDDLERGGLLGVGVPVQQPCAGCTGSGRAGLLDCEYCFGRGTIEQERTVRISVPPHVHDGSVLDVPLDGLGIENTYLRVRFRTDPDRRFDPILTRLGRT